MASGRGRETSWWAAGPVNRVALGFTRTGDQWVGFTHPLSDFDPGLLRQVPVGWIDRHRCGPPGSEARAAYAQVAAQTRIVSARLEFGLISWKSIELSRG